MAVLQSPGRGYSVIENICGFKSHFIPAQDFKSPQEAPLVLVLHGKGDSLKPFLNFQEELELPNLNFLLLNAPRKYARGFSWYGDPPYQQTGVERIRARLTDVLLELEKQGWSSNRIFLLGFSQGCLVSADVALHYGKSFAGVIGISGYFNFEPRWRNKIRASALRTPWLLTHGRQDDVLPIKNTKYGVQKLRQIGLKIDWVESDKKHSFENEDYEAIQHWVYKQL